MERILVVEDDRAVQKALKRLFEAEGFAVEISGDGKSALERIVQPPRRQWCSIFDCPPCRDGMSAGKSSSRRRLFR